MWLPGDRPVAEETARMLRVDHAGEYGAGRIYGGQLRTLRDRAARPVIAHMQEQEAAHLAAFETLLRERRVRPSLLMPLWQAGGWLLGAATAAASTEAAMTCTVAVEAVIDRHYAAQEATLAAQAAEPELLATLARFRAEELEHHDTGLAHGAERSALYAPLRSAIGGLTRAAVWLAIRI